MAPFVKENVLARLLRELEQGVRLTLITRWRAEEVAAGASDVSCWWLAKGRSNASFLLCPELHAKYYRLDERVLFGSANLTASALGWVRPTNLELLRSGTRLRAFEREVMDRSHGCSDALAQAMQEAADHLHALQPYPPKASHAGADGPKDPQWLPLTRHPADLCLFYRGDTEDLTGPSRETAAVDMRNLQVPAGLPQEGLHAFIRAELMTHPLVRDLDPFLRTPRRFGEVADWLVQRLEGERDPKELWQTLMRWLLYFMPTRYVRSRSRHTESLVCVDL